jgi:hypothetical protein
MQKKSLVVSENLTLAWLAILNTNQQEWNLLERKKIIIKYFDF